MKKLLPYLPQFCRWSALLFLLAVLASPAMAQVKPETASTGKIEPTAVNANHELVLCRDGSVKGWGDNSYSQLGFNPGQVATPANIIIPSATDIVRVALTTNGASFAVRASGQLLAWGNNANGLLGLGPNVTQNSIPAVVPLPSPVISIAGGSLSVAALCADGTVWTWGDNRFGGLGDNSPTTTTRYIPAQIPSSLLANVRTIAAGEEFSLALTANGQMFSWGNDFAGCLGIGILSQSINRIQRSPALLNLANVRQIDASYSRAKALRTDGTVWAWGRNSASQLGISNSNYTSTPTQVAAGIITDARWVSMNLDGHIAVRPTGATYVWGFNAGGCFASPTPAISTVPIAGPTLSPGVQIIGRITHFMSLETNGIVKTWGGDNLGY